MSELSSLAEYYSHISTMTPLAFGDPGAGNYSYGIVHQEGLRLRSKFRQNAHALRTGITQHRLNAYVTLSTGKLVRWMRGEMSYVQCAEQRKTR